MSSSFVLRNAVGAAQSRQLRDFWEVSRKDFTALLNTKHPRRQLTEKELSLADNLDTLGNNLIMRKGSFRFGPTNALTTVFPGAVMISSHLHLEADGNQVIFFHFNDATTSRLAYISESESFEFDATRVIKTFTDLTQARSDWVSRPGNEVYFVTLPADVTKPVRNQWLQKAPTGVPAWTANNLGIEFDENIEISATRFMRVALSNVVGIALVGDELVGLDSGARFKMVSLFKEATEIEQLTNISLIEGETVQKVEVSATSFTFDRYISLIKPVLDATLDFTAADQTAFGDPSGANADPLVLNIGGVLRPDLDLITSEFFQVGDSITVNTTTQTANIISIDVGRSNTQFVRGTVGYVVTNVRAATDSAGDIIADVNGDAQTILAESAPTNPLYVHLADWTRVGPDDTPYLPTGQINLDLRNAFSSDPQVNILRVYRTANLITEEFNNDFLTSPTNRFTFRHAFDVEVNFIGFDPALDLINILDNIPDKSIKIDTLQPNPHRAPLSMTVGT